MSEHFQQLLVDALGIDQDAIGIYVHVIRAEFI